MVYFLWDRLRVLVKIGGTCRLRTRLDQQGVYDDDRVILIGVMAGEKGSEYYIQRYVQCYTERVRNSDWYVPNKEVMDFVNAHVGPPIVFDWSYDASRDEDPNACRLILDLVTNARIEWLKKLGKIIKKPWNDVSNEALKAFAISHGFAEPLPDLPKFKRRKPLLKRDKSGEWWVFCHDTGNYISGGNDKDRPDSTDRRHWISSNGKPVFWDADQNSEEEIETGEDS